MQTKTIPRPFPPPEMYPVPPAKETQGLTDKYIGTWLKTGRVRREDIVLASKVGQHSLCLGAGQC